MTAGVMTGDRMSAMACWVAERCSWIPGRGRAVTCRGSICPSLAAAGLSAKSGHDLLGEPLDLIEPDVQRCAEGQGDGHAGQARVGLFDFLQAFDNVGGRAGEEAAGAHGVLDTR